VYSANLQSARQKLFSSEIVSAAAGVFFAFCVVVAFVYNGELPPFGA
jgi:hypothetical protein